MSIDKMSGWVIIQPTPQKRNSGCPVQDIAIKIRNVEIPSYIKYLIMGNTDTLMEEVGRTNIPDKIVLIAHGSRVQNSFESDSGYKNANWWDLPRKVDMIIAHACHSAHI